MKHDERKHSKFSASGATRWFNCPGSVKLSEGMPDKSSVWSEEGTKAHEVLEFLLTNLIGNGFFLRADLNKGIKNVPDEMFQHAARTARFIFDLHKKLPGSEILVETRIYLKFIHPEMFGTFDGAVVDHFDTLHVLDYKYGAGVPVSPNENLQMIFYALGLAHKLHWNFNKARLWIDQPRIKGYDGPVFWDIAIDDLKRYEKIFAKKVEIVERKPDHFAEGDWCHWCKAKSVCPLKQEKKFEKALEIFTPITEEDINGETITERKKAKKESGSNGPACSEAEWRSSKRARNKTNRFRRGP